MLVKPLNLISMYNYYLENIIFRTKTNEKKLSFLSVIIQFKL
jgi:hypothetical protein